jgi:hypothetical protein
MNNVMTLLSTVDFHIPRHHGRALEFLAAIGHFNESQTFRAVAYESSIGLRPWCGNSFSREASDAIFCIPMI